MLRLVVPPIPVPPPVTIRHSACRFGVLAALVLLFSAATARAVTFSTLEERMSASQFKAAGLDKLSPEELATLNAWLQGNAVPAGTAAPGVTPSDPGSRIGFREQSPTGSVVSRLDGTFTGWDGKTRFNLENGQVWEQAEQGTVRGVNIDRPMVTIEPGLFGSWKLKVEGLNATTRVKRIK